jgi:hypothetical protein
VLQVEDLQKTQAKKEQKATERSAQITARSKTSCTKPRANQAVNQGSKAATQVEAAMQPEAAGQMSGHSRRSGMTIR